LKKARVQKIFFLSQLNCSGARRKYKIQELKKAQPELCLPEKFGGEGSLDLAHCLDGAAGTMGGGLTEGGGASIGGGVTDGAEVELVIS